MKRLDVVIHGKTKGDLVNALRELMQSVGAGNLSGGDSTEDGNYSFDIEEIDVPGKP